MESPSLETNKEWRTVKQIVLGSSVNKKITEILFSFLLCEFLKRIRL